MEVTGVFIRLLSFRHTLMRSNITQFFSQIFCICFFFCISLNNISFVLFVSLLLVCSLSFGKLWEIKKQLNHLSSLTDFLIDKEYFQFLEQVRTWKNLSILKMALKSNQSRKSMKPDLSAVSLVFASSHALRTSPPLSFLTIPLSSLTLRTHELNVGRESECIIISRSSS